MVPNLQQHSNKKKLYLMICEGELLDLIFKSITVCQGIDHATGEHMNRVNGIELKDFAHKVSYALHSVLRVTLFDERHVEELHSQQLPQHLWAASPAIAGLLGVEQIDNQQDKLPGKLGGGNGRSGKPVPASYCLSLFSSHALRTDASSDRVLKSSNQISSFRSKSVHDGAAVLMEAFAESLIVYVICTAAALQWFD